MRASYRDSMEKPLREHQALVKVTWHHVHVDAVVMLDMQERCLSTRQANARRSRVDISAVARVGSSRIVLRTCKR